MLASVVKKGDNFKIRSHHIKFAFRVWYRKSETIGKVKTSKILSVPKDICGHSVDKERKEAELGDLIPRQLKDNVCN